MVGAATTIKEQGTSISGFKHNLKGRSTREVATLMAQEGPGMELAAQQLQRNVDPFAQTLTQFARPSSATELKESQGPVYGHAWTKPKRAWLSIRTDTSVDRGVRAEIGILLTNNRNKAPTASITFKYIGESQHAAMLRLQKHKAGSGAPLFTAFLTALGDPDESVVLSLCPGGYGSEGEAKRKDLEATWAGVLQVAAVDGTGANMQACGLWVGGGHLRERMQVIEAQYSTQPKKKGKDEFALSGRRSRVDDVSFVHNVFVIRKRPQAPEVDQEGPLGRDKGRGHGAHGRGKARLQC
jgi:hypothetical protein